MRIFLFILLLTFNNSFANQEELQAHLNRAWNEIYRPLTCSDNVYELYQSIVDSETKFNKASIVHIFHQHVPYEPIFATNQRTIVGDKTYQASRWTFHAFLVIDGYVLDLDYSNEPTLISFSEYMKTMWNKTSLANYRFQIKPAQLYEQHDLDGSMNGYEIFEYSKLLEILAPLAQTHPYFL